MDGERDGTTTHTDPIPSVDNLYLELGMQSQPRLPVSFSQRTWICCCYRAVLLFSTLHLLDMLA